MNDGTGQLVGPVAPFGTGRIDAITQTSQDPNTEAPSNIEDEFDINGDGLVDHWYGAGSNASVQLNDGTQFRYVNSLPDLTSAIRPGNDGFPNLTNAQVVGGSIQIYEGNRYASSRTMDVDRDGRQDVAQLSLGHCTATTSITCVSWTQCPVGEGCASSIPLPETVYFNQGGQFATGAGQVLPQTSLQQTMVASRNQYGAVQPDGFSYAWEDCSDLVDLDGDGLDEAADFSATESDPYIFNVSAVVGPAQPLRSMSQIDNGRGLVTSVTYAPFTNNAVVEQHPETGKYMPHASWVVQSEDVTDSLANTTSHTSYYYVSPNYLRDDRGRYGFRGFDEVRTTTPSGAKQVDRYLYTPDWSGKRVETLVFPAATDPGSPGPTEVRSIDTAKWMAFTLFGGAITTYHETLHEHFTCKNGQTEGTCLPSTAGQYLLVTTSWSPCESTNFGAICDATTTTPNANTLLWISNLTLSQTGSSPADTDLTVNSSHAVYADGATYRVRPLRTSKYVRLGGSNTLAAQSQQTWDSAFKVPLTDETWFDSSDATRAITRRAYDMTTGNVVQRWKPVQNAASTGSATYTYDSRKLFVATEVLEPAGSPSASQTLSYTYEYGTGTRLATIGPNIPYCVTLSNCPSGTPTAEETQLRVDGLGRMIERWETVGDGTSSYVYDKVETSTYSDGFSPPPSVTHLTAIAPAGTLAYVQERFDYDGHGRIIRSTKFAPGAAANEVTTLTYAADGTLVSASVPDPSLNSAATVTYTASYDSLGRPISSRRPDAPLPANQSGVNISYDGASTTRTEVTGAAGGQSSQTVTTVDSYGRLSHLDELVSGTTYATTTYLYDANNDVKSISSSDGIVTLIGYDFAGRRTQIQRGGRTWTYRYDMNGNINLATVPYPIGGNSLDYTTSTAYDDLDRPISKIVGQRTLATGDQSLFAARTETYTWDNAPTSPKGNYKGRLTSWSTLAPGASQPALTSTFKYDAQGMLISDAETLTIASMPTLSRTVTGAYSFVGPRTNVVYGDNFSPNNTMTSATTSFDGRGLPYSVAVSRPGGSNNTVTFTRNVAGLVTQTLASGSNHPGSTWTYDALGRVLDQNVRDSAGASAARQSLSYLGNDDINTLDQYLGTNHKTFPVHVRQSASAASGKRVLNSRVLLRRLCLHTRRASQRCT